MGTTFSANNKLGNQNSDANEFLQKHPHIQIPIEILVAHFTPSSFPVVPKVSLRSTEICRQTWALIVKDELDENGSVIQSGLTSFYTDFYLRLNDQDKSGELDAVISQHISGKNKIAAKGSVIIRVVKYALSIESDSKQIQYELFKLGKFHAKMDICPWQYSIFIEALLLTISSKLNALATNNVMESWVNLFAFILKCFLPGAIKDRSLKSAANISTNMLTGEVKAKRPALESIVDRHERNSIIEQTSVYILGTPKKGDPTTSFRMSMDSSHGRGTKEKEKQAKTAASKNDLLQKQSSKSNSKMSQIPEADPDEIKKCTSKGSSTTVATSNDGHRKPTTNKVNDRINDNNNTNATSQKEQNKKEFNKNDAIIANSSRKYRNSITKVRKESTASITSISFAETSINKPFVKQHSGTLYLPMAMEDMEGICQEQDQPSSTL